MKRLSDHTTLELVELTDDEVLDLVDLECAHAGTPLLPPFPLEPTMTLPPKDVTGWRIGYTGEMIFQNREDALRISELIGQYQRIKTVYVSGYSNEVGEFYVGDAPDIRQDEYYSKEQWAVVGTLVEAHQQATKDYKAAKEDYDSCFRAREEVRAEVLSAIRAARQSVYDRNTMCELYTRYLKLAANDPDVALRFLKEAKSNFSNLFESDELFFGQYSEYVTALNARLLG